MKRKAAAHSIVELINEEIDRVLLEQEGLSRIFARDELPGVMLSPVVDVANAFKKFGAKVGLKTASLLVSTFEQAIAAVTPFNDPRMVDYIAAKYKAFEHKQMEFIDRQFEKETAWMRQGWETFKTDFWGLGFVASPFGAIAAAVTAGKGIDAALSVLNVITAGYVQRRLDSLLNSNPQDPGSAERFLSRGSRSSVDNSMDRGSGDYGDYIDEARDPSSLGSSVEALRSKLGVKEANKILSSLVNQTLKDDKAKKFETRWVQQNLPGVVHGILSSAEQAIDKVEPGKGQALKANAGKVARVLVKAAAKNVSPEVLQAVEAQVQKK